MHVAKTLTVLCASFITLTCHAKAPHMSDIRTYCIGRYVVDVPADAQINGEDYRYMFGRIESQATPFDIESFNKMVDRRADELRAINEDKGRTLKGTISATPTARALITSENVFGSKNYGFEAYWLAQHTLFTLKAMDMDEVVFETRVLPKLQNQLLPHLQARSQEETPTQPGFCLKDGFIANDGTTSQFENAAISFKFAQWPGVLVSVQTMTVTKLGQPSLFQRVDGVGLPDAFKNLVSQIRILRRGQRTINGRAGEEILSTLPTDAGYRLHQFQWEADGMEVSNGLKPTITVELESGMTQENGVPTRPLLTDEQAIALFDAVANSVRLRPVITAETPKFRPHP
ncbi:T6SS immunity protein Tli4 family protein [Trinickia sp. EG282A]|uniref:T6SS immunity protein Tli4 family protein n=1 Tax=Trinickia sp. EG282A TaxID=3237013 RepID=UPI0034D2C2E3